MEKKGLTKPQLFLFPQGCFTAVDAENYNQIFLFGTYKFKVGSVVNTYIIANVMLKCGSMLAKVSANTDVLSIY